LFTIPGLRIYTTDVVNDLERRLQQNRDAFIAGPRTAERKTAALRFYDESMEWLRSSMACGSSALADAGKRCIEERQREGDHPWPICYRDPIDRALVE
jgi:hypothetical protein